MVSPEHVMRASQVLPHQGVEHRLARPGVAHVPQQRGGAVDVLPEEAVGTQVLVGQHDGLVDVVALFFLADDRADQHAVGLGLHESALHQVLMAGVGDVAGLVSHGAPPSHR